ncbi:hypothetical protein [Actinokineospora alba]|uniref:hypothetical protein n=1 Tax=Actinokineospora alba TaxID=504798 RepID=UPI001E432204|nr:hypothetical protein [Actinokineospora alba]
MTQASAQTTAQQPSPTYAIKPNYGPVGTQFTASWSNAPCRDIRILWDGAQIAATVAISGSVGATVPSNAAVGSHTVEFSCSGKTSFGKAAFRVTAPPTTSRPPVTTTTNPPVTTTTRPPVVTTTTRPRPTTTTTRPTTTTTPVTTTTETTPPTTDVPTTTPEITTVPEPKRDLKLDREAIQPGDSLEATGRGCDPNHSVVLTSGGEKVGATVADGQGEFRTKVQFGKIVPGRHLIAAECGIVLTGAVDQLVTSSTGGSSSTLVILVFFVLAGAALIRFT